MPERIQLSRAKGWKMPENTVKVDRTTRYGNPFKVTEDRSESDAAMAFHTWLTVDSCHAGIPERRATLLAALPQLRGKNLACWCKPGKFCHADVLLELANSAVPCGVREFCRFPDCKCPMDPGPQPDWCAIGLPHQPKGNTEMSMGTIHGTDTVLNKDRRTVPQLLAAAAKDTDAASVFYNGTGPADYDSAIVVIKGRENVDYVVAMLVRQQLATVGKPVEGGA